MAAVPLEQADKQLARLPDEFCTWDNSTKEAKTATYMTFFMIL